MSDDDRAEDVGPSPELPREPEGSAEEREADEGSSPGVGDEPGEAAGPGAWVSEGDWADEGDWAGEIGQGNWAAEAGESDWAGEGVEPGEWTGEGEWAGEAGEGGEWTGPDSGEEGDAGGQGGEIEAGPQAEGAQGEAEGPGAPAQGTAAVRRRRRPLLIGLAVVLAALVLVGVLGFVSVSHDINPPGRPGRAVVVKIPTGASTLKIADLLAKAGVIHGPTVFEVYVKLRGGGPLLPGTYHLATNEAYSAVIQALEQGPPPVTYKLVVPEGFTIAKIAAAVGRLGAGISAKDFVQAATSGQVSSPYEPTGTTDLEGLLFPATYPVQPGETADELVQYMVDTFDFNAGKLGLVAAAKKLGYSPYQVVTVASIVEREAKWEKDRGPIASAIYNRLSAGMPLGADSTLLYGLGNPKGPVNFNQPNRYNTRLHKGLPPTPISNPGIPSLQAAMSPPKTTYLYWVEINRDGQMGFGSSGAQFTRLQSECRAAHLC